MTIEDAKEYLRHQRALCPTTVEVEILEFLFSEVERLEKDLKLNASMLAKQCDLAREAEADKKRLKEEVKLLRRTEEFATKNIFFLQGKWNEAKSRLTKLEEAIEKVKKEMGSYPNDVPTQEADNALKELYSYLLVEEER